MTFARFVQICSNPFSLDQQRHLIIEIEKENLEEFSTNLKSLSSAIEEIAKKMEKGWREAERVPSESNIDQRRELSTILS